MNKPWGPCLQVCMCARYCCASSIVRAVRLPPSAVSTHVVAACLDGVVSWSVRAPRGTTLACVCSWCWRRQAQGHPTPQAVMPVAGIAVQRPKSQWRSGISSTPTGSGDKTGGAGSLRSPKVGSPSSGTAATATPPKRNNVKSRLGGAQLVVVKPMARGAAITSPSHSPL